VQPRSARNDLKRRAVLFANMAGIGSGFVPTYTLRSARGSFGETKSLSHPARTRGHQRLTFVSNARRRCQLVASAAEERPERSQTQSEIDFAKLQFSEGNELSGMVFKPDAELAKAGPDESRARLAYSNACEEAINSQINVEFTAFYVYYALHAYFDRDTVALPGFADYFRKQAEEERDHAVKLMHYQNKRGGRVHLKPIAVPALHFHNEENSDAIYAMELALQLEKYVQMKLMEVWKVADRERDANMTDFIEDFLDMQVESIKEISDYVAQLKRVGTGHGVYHFDRVLADK
jgi:ferritin heavy chain